MAGKLQEVKGRVEKAVGKITHNERLQQKGEIDKAAGQLKQAVSQTKRMMNKAITKAARDAKKEV